MISLEIDTTLLALRMSRYARHLPDLARRAATASAFQLRRETPEIVRSVMDRPTKATQSEKSYFVQFPRGTDLHAELYARPYVNDYLAKAQFGLDDDYTNRPIAGIAGDRYGNISKRFKAGPARVALDTQTVSVGAARVGKYFVKRSDRFGGGKVLYERLRGNAGLRAISVQEFDKPGKKTIDLLGAWQRRGTALFRNDLRFWIRRFIDNPSNLPRR